ncbi:MAG TPA: alkaline phosphatase family protein [Vicinamibacterales bacterium]|nr:alkaline phosphatase family protein [Vicinamibacterales bacterium]
MKRLTTKLRRAGRALAAVALMTAIAAPTVTRAAGQPGADDRDDQGRGDRDDDARAIRYVVVIFQENVSFDHYFATYPNATNTDGTPFTGKAGTPIVNGLFLNGLLTNNPNKVPPFRLSSAEAVTCDQDHDYDDEQKAYNGRAMNRFFEHTGVGGPGCPDYGRGQGLVMGYYDGNTVTAMWHYAQTYAMSDNSYGTGFGPSTPGALNLAAGQTWGATIAADKFGNFGSPTGNVTDPTPAGQSFRTVIGDPRPGPALDNCTLPSSQSSTRTYVTMTGRNVGDLLNDGHVTWGWFQGGFRPAPNGNASLSNTPGGTGPVVCGSVHSGLAGASYDYIPHHEPFQYYPQTANPKHLPPSSSWKIGETDQANHQYDLQDFWTAVDAGRIPAVSFLKAAAYQDGHPGYSDPLDEQTFVTTTINRLMSSPEWAHMAIIIAYDDSDGWYDHEAGPVLNQSNTQYDWMFPLKVDANGNPITGNCGGPLPLPGQTFQGRCGLGPRLPLMVISPWARQNYVDHGVTSQSSILRFIEDNWGLGRLGNESADAKSGSLFPLFDFDEHHARAPKLLLNSATGAP